MILFDAMSDSGCLVLVRITVMATMAVVWETAVATRGTAEMVAARATKRREDAQLRRKKRFPTTHTPNSGMVEVLPRR